MRLRWGALLLALLLLFCSCSAQGTVDNGSEDANTENAAVEKLAFYNPLGHGMNLGNMLESPEEGMWGERFEDEYAQLIKNCGFDHVRLPVAFGSHAEKEAPYSLDNEFMMRVDHVVNTCLSAGLKVILDFHSYDDLSDNFTDALPRFLGIWRQVSERYRDTPDGVLFELINEPEMTIDEHNRLLSEVIPLIRQTNDTRYLLVTAPSWDVATPPYSLELPRDDSRIIVTFHLYAPFEFTHQGADWIGYHTYAWLGTTWQETDANTAEILDYMEKARLLGLYYGVPIHMGEFGAYGRADYQSRVAWTRYVVKQAERRGFSWSYWEFCSAFGIYENEQKIFYEELLQALQPDTP